MGSGGTKDGGTWANLVRQVEMENGKKRNKWAHSAKPTFSNAQYSLPFDWRWPKNCMKPQIFIGYNVPSSFGQ